MATPARPLDESLINYFDEELVAHADVAFRFAFGLTLSLDGAHQIVRRAFATMASELGATPRNKSVSAVAAVVHEAWRAYQSLKGQRFTPGATAVTKALRELTFEMRAALLAVDVAGLGVSDTAKAFGWSETDVRRHLAGARRVLMSGALDF